MSTKLSYVHGGGDTPLIGGTIDRVFRDVVARQGDRAAVVSVPQDARLSYADLDAEVERVARGLVAIGTNKGDRVGIWATDNVEWVVVQLATARVGAILVNVNPAYRTSELRHALELARVQTVFLIPSFRSSHYVDMVHEICSGPRRPPDLRHGIVYDPLVKGPIKSRADGFLTWHDLIERGLSVADEQMTERAASLDQDDPVNIQFTSGTTGFPKAVVLTHHSIVNNAFFTGRGLGLTPDDRVCVPLPFYHCFGMVVSNLACLIHGAVIVIPAAHFEAGSVLAAIESERCTVVHGVPTMFVAEFEHPDFDARDLSSLRTGIMGGAPCPPDLMRRVMDDMGCREILIAYGQTEASPVTHITRRDDSFERRVGTVGTNLPHQEVKVIDPATGRTCPIGEPGEVCFRGYHVMRGYFDQPEATRDAIDEAGWLHSGDVAVLDDDGYLRITGRLKDMIIRGGENIYPAEIEAFYCEHPKVAEVAVFGIPDERLGERVGAWIRLHAGLDADPEELRAYARERIAHFKVPERIWIVDEFPMTVTGKIQKFRIREIVEESLREADPKASSLV